MFYSSMVKRNCQRWHGCLEETASKPGSSSSAKSDLGMFSGSTARVCCSAVHVIASITVVIIVILSASVMQGPDFRNFAT